MDSVIYDPRRSPRLAVQLHAEVAHAGEGWAAETEDVGPGGCLVRSPRPLVERAPILLVVRSRVMADALRVAGRVAWADAGRGGVEFVCPRFAAADDAAAWLMRLVAIEPRLACGLSRAPARVRAQAPVYFIAAPPDFPVRFSADEAALLRHARDGIAAVDLLARSGRGAHRGARALFSLLEKRVLSLSPAAEASRRGEEQGLVSAGLARGDRGSPPR